MAGTSGIHAGEKVTPARLAGAALGTDKMAGLIVLAGLGFLIAVRLGFRGALGD